jgi:hypothetical protein
VEKIKIGAREEDSFVLRTLHESSELPPVRANRPCGYYGLPAVRVESAKGTHDLLWKKRALRRAVGDGMAQK